VSSKQYFIYIATNKTNTVLYTGVTNNLIRRGFEHRNKSGSKFAAKYNVIKLVYDEVYTDIIEALNREKQIKAGSRKKKLELIQRFNPTFRDLWDEILK